MVMQKITMPKLGESVVEGTIIKWLVKPGDKVKQYDNLLEVETDKVVAEVPSNYEGIIGDLLAKEGETIAVGEVICNIETANDVTSNAAYDENKSPKGDEQNTAQDSNNTNKPEQVADNFSNNQAKTLAATNYSANSQSSNNINKTNSTSNIRYSPAVLQLANQHNIDLSLIQGSGLSNRVTRKDILNFIAKADSNPKVSNDVVNTDDGIKTQQLQQAKPQSQIQQNTIVSGQDTTMAISPIRRAIAKKMVQSKREIPHAWLMIEVDASALVKARNLQKDVFYKTEGTKLTVFAFVIEAAVRALKNFPLLNSVWAENNIILKKDINVAIAVADNNNNLFVPVIKNADSKSVTGLAKDINQLAAKARNMELTNNDVEGATFTINNTGAFGSIQSMGIINHPQVAILQVETIRKKPVVVNNSAIAIKDMLNLCLSIDHRVVDGLVAGNFLQQVKYNIENISAN